MNIKEITSKLTLEEKAALCSGISSWETTPINRLNIPSIFVSDGPHGLRKEVNVASFANLFDKSVPATCFPPAVTLASSWNRELAEKVGQAIANEAKDQGVDVILGPGINIKRSPLCGRNFEYFSEDPYLTAEMGVAYVNGVQKEKVGTSLKHYAVNSQEFRRFIANSEVDERTLREIYLYAFEQVVKRSDPYTIMCSYNKVNGQHASQNKTLLHDILKEEWGYKGIVISDWGAVDDRVEGIKAGLHIEMPSSDGVRDADIVEAVTSGELSESRLDEIVTEILEFVDKAYKNSQDNKGYKADYSKNHILSKEAANEGAVLLKNDGILPLRSNCEIAVIGALAEKMRYQGSGSSQIESRAKTSFIDYLNKIEAKYKYAPGYELEGQSDSEAMLRKAINTAEGKDVVILFIGLTEEFESESYDRSSIEIPESHLHLLEEVYKANKNIVVVLTGGSATNINYLDKTRALLYVGLPGEAGGESNYELLYGKVNPSGKLAETYPISLASILSSQYFGLHSAEHREGPFVGYRYFDKANKEVRFPFGYGLSYTSFEYSDIKLSLDKVNVGDSLTVSFKLKNTGKLAGAEVAQLYIRNIDTINISPDKELKGFDKIYLEPGEEKLVNIVLEDRSFSFYNVQENEWQVEKGEFEILVGSSSRDIRLQSKIYHAGNEKNVIDYRLTAPSYFKLDKVESIPLADFENVLGRPVIPYIRPKHKHYDFNTCVGEIESKGFGRFFKWISIVVSKNFGTSGKMTKAKKKMIEEGTYNIPLRNMYAQSMGNVSKYTVEGLLNMLNGKFFKGLGLMIKGSRAKKHVKQEKYLSIDNKPDGN